MDGESHIHMRRAYGGLDLVEVRVDLLNARVSWLPAINQLRSKYIIDNRSIQMKETSQRRCSDFQKSYEKIYGLLSQNCDHRYIAQFLLTGQVE